MFKRQWKKLRIRTQISIFLFVAQILILSLIIGLLLVNLNFLEFYYEKASISILVQQELNLQTNLMNYSITDTKLLLYRSLNQIYRVKYLFQKIEMEQIKFLFPTFNCLQNFTNLDNYAFQYSFCYGEFGQANTEPNQIEFYKNLTSSLTILLHLLDQDLDLSICTTTQEQYFAVWPGDKYIDYKPQTRPWYLSHIRQMQNNPNQDLFFSDPFVFWTWNVVMISQTLTIQSQNGGYQGIAATDLNLTLFQNLNSHFKRSNRLFTLRDGKILISNTNFTFGNYIYNESTIGLNYEDFIQIQHYLNNGNYTSNCLKLHKYLGYDIFCRYNQVFQQDQAIFARNLGISNLDLIIIFDTLQNQEQILKSLEEIKERFLEFSAYSFFFIIIIILLSFLINLIVIKYITRPLQNVVIQVQQYIRSSGFIYDRGNTRKIIKENNQDDMSRTLNKVFNNFQIKNNECQRQQLIISQYPINCYNFKNFYKISDLKLIQNSYFKQQEIIEMVLRLLQQQSQIY
ncbi:unnamed protein product [Paramecium primaurelia]|uniref:Transmembrane protein n=1 Tax=Paramecium primaurelia TaxID=5886 RepID=A0A8S1LJ02_PARPR|nr:unnamed protein product [Paramecium primaurelia]